MELFGAGSSLLEAARLGSPRSVFAGLGSSQASIFRMASGGTLLSHSQTPFPVVRNTHPRHWPGGRQSPHMSRGQTSTFRKKTWGRGSAGLYFDEEDPFLDWGRMSSVGPVDQHLRQLLAGHYSSRSRHPILGMTWPCCDPPIALSTQGSNHPTLRVLFNGLPKNSLPKTPARFVGSEVLPSNPTFLRDWTFRVPAAWRSI